MCLSVRLLALLAPRRSTCSCGSISKTDLFPQSLKSSLTYSDTYYKLTYLPFPWSIRLLKLVFFIIELFPQFPKFSRANSDTYFFLSLKTWSRQRKKSKESLLSRYETYIYIYLVARWLYNCVRTDSPGFYWPCVRLRRKLPIVYKRNFPMSPPVRSMVGRLVDWSDGWSVCHNFVEGQEVSLPCFYRST